MCGGVLSPLQRKGEARVPRGPGGEVRCPGLCLLLPGKPSDPVSPTWTPAGPAVGVGGSGETSQTPAWCLAAAALEIRNDACQEERRGPREPRPGLEKAPGGC